MIRYIISTDGTMIKDLQENKVIYQNDIKKVMVKKLIGYSKQFDTAFYLITESNILNLNNEKVNNYFGETFSGINTINLFNIQKEKMN